MKAFSYNTSHFVYITLDAVARQSIPSPGTKKDEKGQKKSVLGLPQKVHVRSKAPYPHEREFFRSGPGLEETELEVLGHVTKKKKRSESTKKKRKRHLSE